MSRWPQSAKGNFTVKGGKVVYERFPPMTDGTITKLARSLLAHVDDEVSSREYKQAEANKLREAITKTLRLDEDVQAALKLLNDYIDGE